MNDSPQTPQSAAVPPDTLVLSDATDETGAEPLPAAEVAPPALAVQDSESLLELGKALFTALLIALVVRTFLFQPYNIPSGSMEATLQVGDYLFVEKFSYGYSKFSFPWGRLLPSFGRAPGLQPERGDVVVFALPSDPSTDFIKRLVGLPGDRVQMLGGVLYINDRPVPKVRVADYVEDEAGTEHHVAQYRETLPNGKSYLVLDRIADGLSDTTPVYTVPAGHYFMMGDNRDDSDDSRGIVGYVPAENLVGKAELTFFSIDDRKTHWWQFWTWPWAIRTGRLFTLID